MFELFHQCFNICGEQWGATESHVTGRGPVRNWKYVMRMRNQNFRNTPKCTVFMCCFGQEMYININV
jgi:hypothetical protein